MKLRVASKLVFLFRDPQGFGAAIFDSIQPNPSSPLRRSEESFELSLEEGYGIKAHKACGELAHFVDDRGRISVSLLILQHYEPPVLACAINQVLCSIEIDDGSGTLSLVLPFVLPPSKLKVDERNASVFGAQVGSETDFTQAVVKKVQELPSFTQINYEPLACLGQFVHVLKVPSVILIGHVRQHKDNKDRSEELEVLSELGQLLASSFSLSFRGDRIKLNVGKASTTAEEPWRALYG